MRPWLLLAGLVLAPLAACGSMAESAYLRVPDAEPPSATTRVERLVGDLLSHDAARSAAAEKALLALQGAERERLAAHAASIPAERDPRWLLVLDEQGLLPPLPVHEQVAFLLWEARRPEPFYVMKARAALTEQARRDPQPLLAVVQAGLPGTEQVAVALALAGRREAVPVLLARYVASEDEDERRALAEGLRTLLGEETRLRVAAPPEERARRAAEILARFELGRPASTPPATERPRD